MDRAYPPHRAGYRPSDPEGKRFLAHWAGEHRLEPATGNSCRSSPIHVGAAHADVSQSMLPYWVRVMKSKM